MSPKPPISAEQLRALRQFTPKKKKETWHAVHKEDAVETKKPRFAGQNAGVIAMSVVVLLGLSFLGWTAGGEYQRLSRELDQTKLNLSLANDEVARIKAEFASASAIHDLWGMGSQFAEESAGVCAADDDRARVRTATAMAVEMWSDSDVRSQIDLEERVLPMFHRLQDQNVHVAGAALPAGVVAQYRRFRRGNLGDVVMLDASRIVDAESRAAVLGLLRRASQGALDPDKTILIYRYDDYGKVTYPLVEGSSDATVLRANLAGDASAQPVTITAADFPCS